MEITGSREPGVIPPGIVFGRNVIKLPHTSNVFNRAIWIQACLLDNPSTLFKPYTWVSRGESLVRLLITTPRTGIPLLDFFMDRNYNSIHIPSPVSGLLLRSGHDYGEANNWQFNTTLLLPDDEPPPMSGDNMFTALCNFCWDYREYIFFKPSEFKGKFNDDKLRADFSEQKQRQCRIDVALPEFEGYFQEARTRHTQLRPYLKHLL